MSSSQEHEKNVARGLKAALHNDNVSAEAKQQAASRLAEMGEEVPADFNTHNHHVLGGYKAALKNPNVSQEAKDHAASMLAQEDSSHSKQHGSGAQDREKSPNRVLGGYKAAINNPHVSSEAKKHAKEVLGEHEVY